MANEFSGPVNVSSSKGGGFQANENFEGTQSTATPLFNRSEQTVLEASAAALELGPLSAPCWVMVKNLDTTNYITVDTNSNMSTTPMIVPAKGVIIVNFTSATLYGKANTANCQVRVSAWSR